MVNKVIKKENMFERPKVFVTIYNQIENVKDVTKSIQRKAII